MKGILKVEEVFMFLLGIYMFSLLNYQWWWFLVLILTPDIGMLGYLINNKLGAMTYNIFHHKGIAIVCYFIGIYWHSDILQLIGVVLFSHASFDRALGYGLKYSSSFHDTHLGKIGNGD